MPIPDRGLHACRQTAVQQIREQQQAIESARASVLGFKGDIERERKAMQVCSCAAGACQDPSQDALARVADGGCCLQEAEQSARAAQQVVEARRKQINPLNHPLVQQHFQQK